jgi:inosose dehydratase
VLAEMHDLGLTATEFGPDGYLPSDPAARSALLAAHGLTAAGGFVPVVLHERATDPLAAIDHALAAFGTGPDDGSSAPPGATSSARPGGTPGAALGAGTGTGPDGKPVLVLAAATGRDGYDARPELDADGWSVLLANLDRAAEHAAAHGYHAALHPHVGTMVETRDDVHRVLDGAAIPLCLDTGHLLIGGTEPAELAASAASRIGHVHLKDVTKALAMRVTSGELTYTDAVRGGLYQPLGQGDADIPAVVGALARAGYDGWYVLEQDTVLAGPPVGEGPAAQVRESLRYLRALL